GKEGPGTLSTFVGSSMWGSSAWAGEPPRRRGEVGLGVGPPADEKDGVGTVALDPRRHADRVEAARRYRARRPHLAERATQSIVDGTTGRVRERKPPAHVGIDHRVAARNAENVTQQDLGRDAVVGVEQRAR